MSSKIVFNNVSGEVLVDGSPISGGLSPAPGEGYTFLSDSSNQWVEQATSLSWRNRIINGDMRVAQRGTAAVSGDPSYPVDRFRSGATVGSITYTAQQSSVCPTGFSNSILYTVGTAATLSGSQLSYIDQIVELSSISDFSWGTAGAKTVTLSFWVRSSVTGTYCISVRNGGNCITRYSYVSEYSINSANTWERKSITIPGPTNSNFFAATGAEHIIVTTVLGTGSNFQTTTTNSWVTGILLKTANQVNFTNNAGATFYLTGVQLELGSVATPFEMLQYEKQLELCQRYFARLSSLSGTTVGFGAGGNPSNAAPFVYLKYPVQMRATPTFSHSNVGSYDTEFRSVTWTTAYCGSDSLAVTGDRASVAGTIGRGCILAGNSTTAYIDLNAEF